MNDNNALPPQTFPQGDVGVISCAAAGCGALVAPTLNATTTSYSDFSQKLLSTSTDLTLSAARATYGHEQSEKLAVSVAPSPDGPAGGTVTITAGKTVLCTITLTSAKGRCALSARQLKAGAYRLVASYLGDKRYRPSVSPGRELTVVQSGFDVVTMRRAVGAAAGPLTRHRRQSRGH